MSDECSAHPGTPAEHACASCGRLLCERCVAWDVGAEPACDACGRAVDARSRSIGSAVVAIVAVAYLASLAVLWLVFRSRPFVGGLAAVIALVVGRALQMYTGSATPIPREE